MKRIKQSTRREDGAAAVEFALISGVLAMLLFGMLQFGLAFFEIQNLRAAAREGSRIGAVGASEDDVRQRVEEASYESIPADNAAIVLETCPPEPEPEDSYNSYTVSIDIDPANPALPGRLQDIFTVDIPFVPPIVINTSVEGQFRCE